MSENKSFKNICNFLLDSIKEDNKEEVADHISNSSKNFSKLLEYNSKDLLNSRQLLINIGRRRWCEYNVRTALETISEKGLRYKKFLITFVGHYKNYHIDMNNKNKLKKEKMADIKTETNVKGKNQTILSSPQNSPKVEKIFEEKENSNIDPSIEQKVPEKESSIEKLTPNKKTKFNPENATGNKPNITAEKRLSNTVKNEISLNSERSAVEAYLSDESVFKEKNVMSDKSNTFDPSHIRKRISEISLKSSESKKVSEDSAIEIGGETSFENSNESSFEAEEQKTNENKRVADLRVLQENDGLNSLDGDKLSLMKSFEEASKVFENQRVTFLRHGDKIVLQGENGHFLNIERKIESKESVEIIRFHCKNQHRTILEVDKCKFESELLKAKNPFVSSGDKIRLAFLKENKKMYLSAGIESNRISLILKPDQNDKNSFWNIHCQQLKQKEKIKFGCDVSFSTTVKTDKGVQDYKLGIDRDGFIVFEEINKNFSGILNSKSKLKGVWKLYREEGVLNWSTNVRVLSPELKDSPLKEVDIVERLLHSLIGFVDEKLFNLKLEDINNKSDAAIRCETKEENFSDVPLKSNINRFCGAVGDRVTIEAFCAEREKKSYCPLSHSLCAAFRYILLEIDCRVSEINSSNKVKSLLLLETWISVQPLTKVLHRLKDLCLLVRRKEKDPNLGLESLKGGALINLLHEFVTSEGDKEMAKKLFLSIFLPVVKTYLKILSDWMLRGKTAGTRSGFIVEKTNEEEFSLCPAEGMVPFFLKEQRKEVLKTGCFVAAMRKSSKAEEFWRHLERRRDFEPENNDFRLTDITSSVANLYDEVSRKVLDLVIKEESLISAIKNSNKVFILERGDVFYEILSALKTKRSVKRKREELDSLVKVVFEANDSENLSIHSLFWKHSLVDQLEKTTRLKIDSKCRKQFETFQGVESLGFKIRSEWPLSLYFCDATVFKCNLIFRFLFVLKKIEMKTEELWLKHKKCKSLSKNFPLFFLLQTKMRHFLRSKLFFVQNEAESKAKEFYSFLAQKNLTFDSVTAARDKFLRHILRHSFLLDLDVLKITLSLAEICLRFVCLTEKVWGNWFERGYKFQSKVINNIRRNNGINIRDPSQFFVDSGLPLRLSELNLLFDLNAKDLMAALRRKAADNFSTSSGLEILLDFNKYFSLQ